MMPLALAATAPPLPCGSTLPTFLRAVRAEAHDVRVAGSLVRVAQIDFAVHADFMVGVVKLNSVFSREITCCSVTGTHGA